MANPQAENGHVDIAHEIIEALAAYRVPGEAMQCLWVVFRKTYGWKKTEDEISLSQFSEMTGLKRSNVVRAISWLLSKKILSVIKKDTTYANKYRFNKDFELWTPVIKKDTSSKDGIKKDNEVVSKKIRPGVSKKIHTKETSTKETIKRKLFTPPTIEEVTDYCQERKNNIDPQSFLDSNTAKGWVIGKNKTPAKDWQAMIRTWENTAKKDGGGNGLQAGGSGGNGSGRTQSFHERDVAEAKRIREEANARLRVFKCGPGLHPQTSGAQIQHAGREDDRPSKVGDLPEVEDS